jgi:uncharacterized protein YlbG (UPF0298 family)
MENSKILRRKKNIIISACVVFVLIVCVGIAFLVEYQNNIKPIKKDITPSLIISGNPDNIKSGDIVSFSTQKASGMLPYLKIGETDSFSTQKASSLLQELKYVKVVSVSDATEFEREFQYDYGISSKDVKPNPFCVKFAICAQQEEAFDYVEDRATLVLVCHSNDSRVQELLQKQDSILHSIPYSPVSQATQAASSSSMVSHGTNNCVSTGTNNCVSTGTNNCVSTGTNNSVYTGTVVHVSK